MKPLASGRDCDVFDAGPGRVLRRAKDGRSMEHEAQVMAWVRDHGVPTPAVYDASGPDIVMERVTGPSMLDAMVRRPFRHRHFAAVLGDLHDRLHAVPVPPWLPSAGAATASEGKDAVLHFDLHPMNVLLGPDGPVLIDWTNACRGPAAADVAQSWIIMAASDADVLRPIAPLVARLQRRFTAMFLATQDVDAARRQLPAVAEHRKRDRNVRPNEIEAIDALLAVEAR